MPRAAAAASQAHQEGLTILLDRNALEVDLDVAGNAVVEIERHRDRNEAAERDLAALVHRRPVGGQDDVAIEDEAADLLFAQLLRPVGGKPDEVAILLDDAMRNAACSGEAGMLHHVAHLAMDRDDDLRPDPVVHRRQLGPAGMAGDVDRRLAVGDHVNSLAGELVLDPPDRDLVAGDLLGREDDEVAAVELQLVLLKIGRAARGSPWPPVAMIMTSRLGSFIAASKSTTSGKSVR